jgi:hypothetical protein
MIASTTTVPCTPAAFAIIGYTGRMGAINIPSDRNEMRSRPTGAFAGATVTTGPCPSPTPIPFGNPSGVPIPLPNRSSEGASATAVSLLGCDEGRINRRVAVGAAILDEEEAAGCLCTCTTGTGGFGISGIQTFGASRRNGATSGCSRGSAITTPATTNCKPIDANVAHRLLEETSLTRDATRLSSNISAPSNLRI